ncbi:splicing factor 45-like [Myxocyprinus asiaticus]|uniref:splicing factor 45-like n=1 Tax=Myxocyprinus asiaticus TaxID=70543 RepID=UPI0022234E75|nr:splicing factor 45-like [Myxocyprinus asiaticus]
MVEKLQTPSVSAESEESRFDTSKDKRSGNPEVWKRNELHILLQTPGMQQSTVLAPVVDLKRGSSVDDRQISDAPPHIGAGMKDSVTCGFSSGDVLILLGDEYDPMFPNNYEKVVKRHREERQRQRELERQKEIEERERENGTVAHKIMQKYGFREGQGLGKHEQGLSTALSVEKTSKHGGKIIIGDSAEKSESAYLHKYHVQAHTSYAQDPIRMWQIHMGHQRIPQRKTRSTLLQRFSNVLRRWCYCGTWLEGERWMKTWKPRLKKSVRNTAKWSSV